jgi:ATP-binding cassette subfamily F protein 3
MMSTRNGKKDSRESGVQSPSAVRSRKSENPRKSEKDNAVPNVKPLNQANKENSIDKEQKKEIQKQQKLFQQLEEKIAVLNKSKADNEAALADPATYSDKEKFLKVESAYKKINDELLALNKQYEQVFEKIVKLES